MAERVRVREITDEEGQRLLRILRRSTGSVVTWRRAQMVLLSAQGMPVPKIAEVTFTSPDRVREVIHNFNADGFAALYPRYRGGRPPTFTLAQRRTIKQVALSRPTDHGLPFSSWSLSKLAEVLVAEGVVDDHLPRGPWGAAPRGGRVLSTPEDLEALTRPGLREQEEPHPAPGRAHGRHRRCAGWRPGRDHVRGRIRAAQPPTTPWPAVDHSGRWRAEPTTSAPSDLYPPAWRAAPAGRLRPVSGQAVRAHQAAQAPWRVPRLPALPADPVPADRADRDRAGQLQPHLSTADDARVGDWAAANNVELAYTPTNASWLNRIEAQFTALRYFTLDGTDHGSHREQASMIRRYLAWRNRHARDQRLGRIVKRANVA